MMMCIPIMCIKMYTNITNHQIIWLIYLPYVAPKSGLLYWSILAPYPYLQQFPTIAGSVLVKLEIVTNQIRIRKNVIYLACIKQSV